MEYTVYEAKKSLRRNRVKIFLGFTCLLIIFAIVVLKSPNQDEAISNEKLNENSEKGSLRPQEQNTGQKEQDSESKSTPTTTKNINVFTIVKTYTRPGTQYYTQGLIFSDPDTLIESAGLYGESAIQYLKLENMEVGLRSTLASKYFGEGCELLENNGQTDIYQLTWRERAIIVWDAKTLEQKKIIDLPYPIKEGWGITKGTQADDKGNAITVFFITDGTDKIYVVDPQTFKIKKSITATNSNGETVDRLNELEFIKGKIWANIYRTNNIAVINPETGFIEAMIDLSSLYSLAKQKAQELKLFFRSDYVLNGIAYDPANDRLIIAGKKWPLMWEIKVNGV